ncbi:MAG: hypothetical protein MZV64_50060 [Ignavibacteriales bacterium]|nr:hypothetical protein [Ignavibacteriales bacterium]
MTGTKRSARRRARAEKLGPKSPRSIGGDLGVEVVGDALGALPGGGLPGIEEIGAGRELAQAGDGQPLDPPERALAGDVELAEREDARAVELDAEGVRLPGREDVDDAAAPGELAGRGDEVLAGVAVAGRGSRGAASWSASPPTSRERKRRPRSPGAGTGLSRPPRLT